MKKLLLVLFVCLFSSISSAFAQEPYKVYIELLGKAKGIFSTKCQVSVDYGQRQSYWFGRKNQYLVDENGKKIDFNTMVDAMNYFGEAGWSFEQAYVVTEKDELVYHWLLSKEVTSEDEALEGFNTKRMYKQQKKDK